MKYLVNKKSKKIFNGLIKRYEELKYNIVLDTPIKTGKKVNGKDEYVIQRSFNATVGDNKVVNMNLPQNAVIHDYFGIISDQKSTGIKVKNGFFLSFENYFSMHTENNNIRCLIGTNASWVSGMKYYITVYYTV